MYISKDLIINSFIITFNELKTHKYHEMQKVNAELISCDHTFKMASHVSVFRNGKWVPQYDYVCGDNGIYRLKSTPDPDSLCKQLEMFLSKWDKIIDVDGRGRPIITATVVQEVRKLKVHIERGCLSDIPPHFGTSRNENLHRSLNKRFTGNCIGVEVAVALLVTFFIFGTANEKTRKRFLQ